MQTRMLSLTTSDGEMPTAEARPAGASRGGLVVIMEAFGLNAHIREVSERFADAGYHALAPDLYHRAEGDHVAAYDDLDRAIELMGSMSDDTATSDFDACLAHLQAAGHEPSSIGVVGFCMGGRLAFLAAAQLPIGAAVGFYGAGITSARGDRPALVGFADQMRAPWLGLFGDQDPVIPVEDVEELRTALAVDRLDHEVVRYPDAGHGFHCDDRDAYHEPSARDAWQRALEWFERHLG